MHSLVTVPCLCKPKASSIELKEIMHFIEQKQTWQHMANGTPKGTLKNTEITQTA